MVLAAAPVQIRALATGYSLSLGKRLCLSIFRVQIPIPAGRRNAPFFYARGGCPTEGDIGHFYFAATLPHAFSFSGCAPAPWRSR